MNVEVENEKEMRVKRGIEKSNIGKIRENGGMKWEVIREKKNWKKKEMMKRIKIIEREIMGERERIDLDREIKLKIFEKEGWWNIEIFLIDVMVEEEMIRMRKKLGNRNLMVEEELIDMEGRGKSKDRIEVMIGKKEEGDEDGKVEDEIKIIDDGNGRIERKKEIGVERMKMELGIEGEMRRNKRMKDEMKEKEEMKEEMRDVEEKKINLKSLEIKDRKKLENWRSMIDKGILLIRNGKNE